MAAFTLTVVRHGETGHNKLRIIQGQIDAPLSSVGVEQAKILGKHLSQEQWTHVYSSDLSRAKQTAEEIVKYNQFYKGGIICDPRLRERNFGELQGKPFSLMQEMAAKEGKEVFEYCPPGGETLKEVRSRISSFFASLCQTIYASHRGTVANGHVQNCDKASCQCSFDNQSGGYVMPTHANVLAVCHGGLLLEMMHHFVDDLECKMPVEREKALRISPNTGVSKFRVSVGENGFPETMVCFLIHNADHLTSQSKSVKADRDISL